MAGGHLDVRVLDPGDDEGIGKVVSLHTKGWLPYTLRWQFRVTESRYPFGFSLEAWGDFNGRGVWTFEQDGESVNIAYNWKVRADKPLLRALSFLLKPVFAANHRIRNGPRRRESEAGTRSAIRKDT